MNAKAKTHVIQKVLSVRTWRALTGVIAYQASLCHRMENVVSVSIITLGRLVLFPL